MKERYNSLLRKFKTISYYQSIAMHIMLCIGLCAFFLGGLFVKEVYASNDSITITNEIDGSSIDNVTWKAYKIAGYDAHGNIVLDSNFDSTNIDFGTLTTSEEVANAATTFANVVLSDNIAFNAQAISTGGIAKITGLEQGVYLISGSNVKIGSKVYSPSPMIIEVITDSDGVNVDVMAKFAYNKTVYSIEKLWKGDDAKSHTEVVVELYKDGVLNDTIKLNEANNWKYTWDSNDETAVWSVKETTLIKNYKVSYRSEGSDFVVVNTYYPPEEESTMSVETETQPEETTEDETEIETETDETEDETDETEEVTSKKGSGDDEKSGGGSTGDDGNLPQTGLLWWPVIPLLVLGFVLVIVGAKIKNSGEKSEE